MAIGQMKQTPESIRTSNKGVAIDSIHYLGDYF